MKKSHSVSRREFLKMAGVGAAGVASSNLLSGLPFVGKVLAQSDTLPDLEVRLRAVKSEVPILSGKLTQVWTYGGEIIRGDESSLQTIPDSYLGPIFRVQKEQHVRIHFVNDLTEESIVHWHGLILPEAMDGHPLYAIAPGETYMYRNC